MRLTSLIRFVLIISLTLTSVDMVAADSGDGKTEVPVRKRGRSKAGDKTAQKGAKKSGKAKPTGKNADKKQNAKKQKDSKKEEKNTSIAGKYYALKVNVPYAAAVIQNLDFEMEVAKQWSVSLPVMWSLSDLTDRHGIRTIAFQPEVRRWTGNAGRGHFFGVHFNLAWYNLKWNDTRYQARHTPLVGAGVSYGYKLPLSDHWGAEFSFGLGYAYTKYNKYYNITNGALFGSASRNYFGIDRVGISLVYRF